MSSLLSGISLALLVSFICEYSLITTFIREVVERFPALRASIVEKLLNMFTDIKSGKVFRGALWIVGEYAASVESNLQFTAWHPPAISFN
jgi:hypothetical protein